MASPMLSFLRPLGLPRPATVRHFLRFSTRTTCREEASTPSTYTPIREGQTTPYHTRIPWERETNIVPRCKSHGLPYSRPSLPSSLYALDSPAQRKQSLPPNRTSHQRAPLPNTETFSLSTRSSQTHPRSCNSTTRNRKCAKSPLLRQPK